MHQIGLIGVGYWGPNIAKSFELTNRAKVRWLCDLRKEALDNVASKYPHAKTTMDMQDVLSDPEVDAVAISTPVNTHFSITKASLLAQKHTLVEKPISATSQEAKQLSQLAEEQNRILMVGHVFEDNASIQALKKIMAAGELGKIHYLHCERTNLGPVRTDVNAFWDLGTHDISIMNYLLDSRPQSVTAHGECYLNKGLEDVVFATFSFENGPIAHIYTSWLHPRKVRKITVVGSEKMAIWDDLDLQAPVRVYKKTVFPSLEKVPDTFIGHKTTVVDGGMIIPPIEANMPLQAECEHFLDCITNNSKPATGGNSGWQVVKALEATSVSMQNNSVSTPIDYH